MPHLGAANLDATTFSLLILDMCKCRARKTIISLGPQGKTAKDGARSGRQGLCAVVFMVFVTVHDDKKALIVSRFSIVEYKP
jgi:hypothetical protein